ncbi:MAG: 30S ribosomal protein S6 [Clostridiales bacterium]|jgi:small subunit ribosomal protein S6|nr:30S ribosomal protein S6 [Clostridiales bacterium]MBR4495092.1 30S ribosomal protein S6 [Clostridiales bacterium]
MANQYQLVVVLNPASGEEAVNALIESIQSKIAKVGTVDALDNLGTKKLAYEINDAKEGTYFKVLFTAPVEFPRELERVLKITAGVLRFLVVRVGE